jgi:hypothetical protein
MIVIQSPESRNGLMSMRRNLLVTCCKTGAGNAANTGGVCLRAIQIAQPSGRREGSANHFNDLPADCGVKAGPFLEY